MGKIFLNSYNPLCATKQGREASKFYNQPRFVDASNRREPNLEGNYGAISSLCRADLLISRLNIGDIIVYITKKGNYMEGISEAHWNLTAILEVIEECRNHKEAAEWFNKQGLPIPSNCIVEGNLPLNKRIAGNKCNDEEVYRRRSTKFPSYYICKKLYVELNIPPIITEDKFENIFGKVPGTQNPKEITIEQFEELKKTCKI